MTITEQVCCRCQIQKPVTEFDIRKGRPKPSTVCKLCRRAYQNAKAAEYYAQNPEKARAKALAEYHANKERTGPSRRQRQRDAYVPRPRAPLPSERPCKDCGVVFPISEFAAMRDTGTMSAQRRCRSCLNAASRAWVTANPKKRKEIDRGYAERNPEKRLQKQRRYQAANPQKFKLYARKDYLKHHARRRADARAYRLANPDKYKVWNTLREGRKRNAAGTFSSHDLVWKAEMCGGLCYYCQQPLGPDRHLEHKIPLVRGGSNWPANLTYACPTCNLRKGSKTPQEFRAWLLLCPQ